jgi:hypothetical protein
MRASALALQAELSDQPNAQSIPRVFDAQYRERASKGRWTTAAQPGTGGSVYRFGRDFGSQFGDFILDQKLLALQFRDLERFGRGMYESRLDLLLQRIVPTLEFDDMVLQRHRATP